MCGSLLLWFVATNYAPVIQCVAVRPRMHTVCVIILLASRTDSSLLYTPSNSLLLLLRAVPLLPPQPQLTERAITAPAGDR